MDNLRNCSEEFVIRLIGKITLNFKEFEDLDKQIELKNTIEESLYGYDITSQCKELMVSDIKEHINNYLLIRSLEGISKSTIYNYKLILDKFSDFFSTKTISMIKSNDISYFLLSYKKERNVKNSTLNSLIFCLKKFFEYLINNEIIFKNPMRTIKEIKVEKRLKQVMTDRQAELLKDACSTTREELLLNLAMDTGCRVSELSGMNLDCVDFQKLKIKVIGKGNKQRIVYFTEHTKIILEKYIKERKVFEESNAIFVSNKFPYKRIGSRSLQIIMTKIKQKANLGDKEFITIHGNRRYMATKMVNKGIKLSSIQAILGHSNPSTTLVYSRISDSTVERDYRIGI